MRIKKVIIKNFRGYKSEIHVDLDNNLCAIVGKNDVGKSTILDALDIFFNEGKGATKIESEDVSLLKSQNGSMPTEAVLDGLDIEKSFVVGVQFSDVHDREIVVDETSRTTLREEHLLDSEGCLTIIKLFGSGGKAKKILLYANHPYVEDKALILHKNTELKKLAAAENVNTSDVNLSNNTKLRKAIREQLQSKLEEKEELIPMDSPETKNIWEPLKAYLPQFYLFRADRKNSDQDDEVKDPLGIVVKEVFSRIDILGKLREIDRIVRDQVKELGDKTIDELRNIDPALSATLTPSIPSVESLKWADVYKSVSICGDEEIPINKRGSGVRRLVLLGFLLAKIQTEEGAEMPTQADIIYAIEEPETSLHSDLQKLLINALKQRTHQGVQVLVTTHSSTILKELEYDQIRMVLRKNVDGNPSVDKVEESSLQYKSLNEISFLALGEATEEYHNELFGLLQEIATSEDNRNRYLTQFDNWLELHNCTKNMCWREDKGESRRDVNCTIQYYIRNSIHHPENILNVSYSNDELLRSIKEMRAILFPLIKKQDSEFKPLE